jgi:hypothetical protein
MKDRSVRIAAKQMVVAAFLGMMLFTISSLSMAEDPTVPPAQGSVVQNVSLGQCSELVALLAEQDQKNSREFRQIKRDIGALTQQVAEPGMREIFGGVGYILGLFGVAAYVASRKKANGGGR